MADMEIIYHLPLEPMQAYSPNQLSNLTKTSRKRIDRAIKKIKCSKASLEEKDKQIRQVYEKEKEAAKNPVDKSRKTLVPKSKFRNTSSTTESPQVQFNKVSWPELHAEMELHELITARMDLVVALCGLNQENMVPSFFKDADAVCIALWNTSNALRNLLSYEGKRNTISIDLYMSAIGDMEGAIERLTCEILDRTNARVCQRKGGALRLKQQADSDWKAVENKIKASTEKVKKMLMIGSLLIEGFHEGQWLFVGGILETLRILSPSKESGEKDNNGEGKNASKVSHARKTCLMSKTAFMERKKGEHRDAFLNSLKPAATNYYSLLAGTENNSASPLHSDGKTGLLGFSLSSGTKNALQVLAESPTSGNVVPPNNGKRRGGAQRARDGAKEKEMERKRYRETGTQDSDSSTDEDEPGKIREHGPSKRSKPNFDISLLSEPKQGPSIQETPAMRKVRMEIEGVKIRDDDVVGEKAGGKHDETKGGVKDELSNGADVEELL